MEMTNYIKVKWKNKIEETRVMEERQKIVITVRKKGSKKNKT